jgi:Uma2 family endonuclease
MRGSIMADISLERTAVTLDDLMSLGSDARVEVINGVIVEMAPVGGLHHIYGGNLHYPIKTFVDAHDLGLVFMDGLLYLMYEDNRYLRGSFAPDISFIRRENTPASWNLSLPFPGVPDLAVEVISPSEGAEDIQTKVSTYLEKGTEQVWVVYPATRKVHQYRRDQNTVRIYSGSEQIDCESLFPGLVLTLDTIFKLPSWLEKLNQG